MGVMSSWTLSKIVALEMPRAILNSHPRYYAEVHNILGQAVTLLHRMIHTVDEVDAAVYQNRDKLKVDKSSQDFTRRIQKMSGVGDLNAAPDGKLPVHLRSNYMS